MSESRAVPGGEVYRQLFDAQVQLSRSLLAGRRDARTDCLSAEDSNTHCSTASRWLCPPSSRGQHSHGDDDADDVSRLPDTLAVDRPRSDIIKRLAEKHIAALKPLETELTELSQVCETQVRSVSLELVWSLQEVDNRLNTLKDRMEHLEHVSLQEVFVLWEEVEEKLKLKKIRIMKLNHKLTESEAERSNKIKAVLRKYCHLLEKIGFLPPPDVYRLIHSEAMMLNQSLLANCRSVAHLLLLLQEENLKQESLLRLHWEDCLNRWRRGRVNEVIDHFRSVCSSEDDPLVSVQMNQTLAEQRCDIINNICSLVPPSTALVSDWFNQLTAVNQQIDSLHADFIHQLRCCYEQVWQDRLAAVERCKEELSALQLSEEELNEVVASHLLTLIGRSQRQDEKRLAALDLCCDSVARHAHSVSRCVFVVMRGAALLWETHSHRLERKEEEVQQHLDDLRVSQQQHIQRRKVHLDDLLAGLRQESSEDALKMSLDKTVLYLQDIKHSCSDYVSDQCQLLDRVPSVCLEELLSYSSSLASFFHLSNTYTPNLGELWNLHPSSAHPTDPEPSEGAENHPISCQNDADPAYPSQDWLTEAESSLLDLCDISSDVSFTSSSGVSYSGPALRCPAPNLQQETHLSLFPVELLTHTLSRTQLLFFDHLEQHIHDVFSSAVSMVTERKEVVRLEQELHLQQLNPQHIQNHIYQPRLVELQCHRQCVDDHCEEVLEVLTSCRLELQELQTSISRKNQKFSVTLSNMEDDVQSADSSQRLETVSSTLQDCLDEHIKDTQCCETTFRQTVQTRLEEVRDRTSQLLNSFRLFSEGGDFAPQELKLFQRMLKEETEQIHVTEESIYTELELFESTSLQQVKEASIRLEETISLLKSELKFTEKIQKMIRSTQVHIKAEAASSNQQQTFISSCLEDLRRMMGNTQVFPDEVFSVLSSVNEELIKRCQYLEVSLENTSAHTKSRKQVQSAPPAPVLQPGRTGVDLLDNPVIGVIKSLNRFCKIQDVAAEPDEGGTTAAADQVQPGAFVEVASGTSQRSIQRQRESLSARRGCRSIRTDRKCSVFGAGPEPEPERSTHSFSSTVNSVLWRANDVLLLVAEDFYRTERSGLSRFLRLPDSLNQWAESTQQRLLGYQEQTRKFLSSSREELVKQLSVLEELLRLLPGVLISNHELQQEAKLREKVCGVRLKLKETLAASENEKCLNFRQLRVSLRDEELQTLNSREELRQQQLHSAICSTHLELQECVRVKGEEFVTSLASLTENLLHQLDNSLTAAENKAVTSHQQSGDRAVTMETETGQKPVSRTWSSITYMLPPINTPSSVTVATSASTTTTRCTMGHLVVIEQRDAAVKRFEQLIRSELLRSDDDQQKHLRELQSWSTHWRQQIHTLTHTQETADTHTDTHTGDSRYTH
ncbi:coiled-coil domain-containing protein 180 isoform X2 [Acanthopagrus latus]|uniref:coiled-coil domain-containing protein 180 isoform X2 n=1 Tax=Acanthopagrus latus TaxID=8177 RepID=UPI00187C41CD|nr:coiled-coil domain-containing protein 180 isoform X2 [Acanthopagrus latus]